MKHMTVGADIAKNVMQLHYIDAETGEIVSKPVKRAVFLEHFANRAPCLIGMEACGGSQYWARKLTAMGHEVKLMPGKFVKAFVMGNKNDAVDAKAIWLVVQHAERSVAVKTETQQAVLGLHRMREQLVKFRTMQINGLRGLLTEYGEVMGKGRAALDKAIPSVLERLVDRLPVILIDTLREQWNGLAELDKQIAGIERRLQMWMREDKACKAIAAIPGVGLLTATAAVATMYAPSLVGRGARGLYRGTSSADRYRATVLREMPRAPRDLALRYALGFEHMDLHPLFLLEHRQPLRAKG